jgi:hypothetical protein
MDTIKKEQLKIKKNAGATKEAKYIEIWPHTTSAWAGWRRFDIPVDKSCEVSVLSFLLYTSSTLGSTTGQ